MKYSLIAAIILLAAASWTTAAAMTSVRVDASSGVPQIVVDGKAMRARMFFGVPGHGMVPLTEKGRLVSFDFWPTEDEPAKATVQLRFGNTPGDVFLDDIRCVDLITEREVFASSDFESGMEGFHKAWNSWPTGAQNTVGAVGIEPSKGRNGSAGLHVALKAPIDGRWPDFHIYHHANLALQRDHHYRMSLWARAVPSRNLEIAFRRSGKFEFLAGPMGPPSLFHSQIKLAAEAGVFFVTFPVDLPWPKPGQQADWSHVDALCQTVLEANPKALLLPRVAVSPPAWWYDLHPDDEMVWDRKTHGQWYSSERDVVVASPAYRQDAAERLAALVTHLEEKFGDRMAGYHPCGQNSGEWFYQDTWGPALNGYAKGDLSAWRVWLKARYHDDAALQSAWHNPRVTLDTPAVPSSAARRAAPAGVFRDPVAERNVLDFALFQQEVMANCICYLAHAVRQASHGRKLVVFFYGYSFEFGSHTGGVNDPATSGHYALRRVLNCPDVDILCSPVCYLDRGMGQSGPAMSPAESIALARKMWLVEDDTRTYLAGDPSADAPNTLEKTEQVLLRNTGQCALRNFGTWWMDLVGAGWFNDARIWAEMKKLKALDEPLLETPLPFRPEVAAVIDEQSMLRVAAGGQVATIPGVFEVRLPLGRMGAPYGQYLQDDVVAGRVRAKMYVFLTAWCLSPFERKRILDATRDALCLWCYAPGFQENNQTSPNAMRELTGFRMKKVHRINAWAVPTPLGRRHGLQEAFGIRRPIEPLFAAADSTSQETLATYPDGSAAVALRRTNHGLSLFVGPPGLTSQLLRLAARRAGVHLVTQTDCNVYANGPFLVLHASQDGPLEIDTGVAGPIYNVLTGRTVGQGSKIALPLKMGETRVLKLKGK